MYVKQADVCHGAAPQRIGTEIIADLGYVCAIDETVRLLNTVREKRGNVAAADAFRTAIC